MWIFELSHCNANRYALFAGSYLSETQWLSLLNYFEHTEFAVKSDEFFMFFISMCKLYASFDISNRVEKVCEIQDAAIKTRLRPQLFYASWIIK